MPCTAWIQGAEEALEERKREFMRTSKLIRSLAALLMTAMLLTTACPALAENPTGPNTFMVIKTGNSGKLNLRALPTTASESLGLYPNGTTVLVESASNGWAYVNVNGKKGYMATQFLANMGGGGSSSGTAMYVKTGNSGKLHLRVGASLQSGSLGLFPNGTKVLVMGRIGEWAYVNVNGQRGYMMYKFLSFDGSSTPDPVVPPVDPAKAVTMVVKTGNSGKLHLRVLPSQSSSSLGLYPNGTEVQAVNLGNGWHWASVGGKTGYMMSQFLASKGSTPPTPTPVTPYTMYIHTGNSGKLNLRALPDINSTSLGLYPNDLAVTVLATTGEWANVAVDGKMGFMMLKFLTTTVPGGVTPPTPTTTATVRQPNNSYVNLRSSQNSEINNVIAQVPSGTVVTVLSWGNVWCRIQYNGMEGYMVAQYLQK